MSHTVSIWQTRSPETQAYLRAHDPDLARWLERCPHGSRVRVPGIAPSASLAARDAAIRAQVHRWVAEGRSRSWAIEIMAEAHRLTYRHVQKILARGVSSAGQP